ncbi:hypothetical protein [Paraburkholderia antibiotica]|uniref:Uncharacterized protein n=1 Tax=Paraburkholderia antibiotica TaxID=2728839 RepID=A0A7Y0FFL3_9BURK|nr:hypothetical protein [Paraburkholderia antibiotica]NML34249.1 hypothetical protein [Paraburkholderia antibiotica]
MSYEHKVKWCPVCNQGWVEVVKDKASGELFLCCDECETEWTSPDAIANGTGTQGKFGMVEAPDECEIESLGWAQYIMK